MDEKNCGSCKHFIQHYGLNKRKLFRIYCGHCTVSHRRHKSPFNKACQNFLPGIHDTDAFVTKEFLSKELLQYLLDLPLLPEIEELPDHTKDP